MLGLGLSIPMVGVGRGKGGSGPSAFAIGVLSFVGNAVDGDKITIGSTLYHYVTVLAQAYDVLIGATASITIINHVAAVNGAAGEGIIYGDGTLAQPEVTAASIPGKMIVTAREAGSAGNAIDTSSSSSAATWGAASLQGGA